MTRSQDKRILVVDDEPDVVIFLRTALEDSGFQVESALSVDEALGKIKERPPDCISLDMVMPRKSGIILFHELRRNPKWSKIPVLFVTGHAREDSVRKDLAAAALADSTLSGPSTYLEKPVTAQVFVKAVANLLSVDLEETGEDRQPTDDVLRQQLLDLLKGADSGTLQKALNALRQNKAE
jgi:CheY-like chemotaxis protein